MSADDVVAVQQLAATYADAISRFAVDEAVSVYAPDGVLASPTTGDATGRAAIAAMLTATVADLELLFQTVHLGVVRVDGDTARARFPITEWARRRSDGRPLQFLGWYDDEAVRLDEGWRFARRTLVPRTLGRPPGLDGRLLPVDGLTAL